MNTAKWIDWDGGRLRLTLMSEENRRSIRIFFRNRLAVVGMCILVIWLLVALMAPYLSPYPFDEQMMVERLQPPNRQHLFGTDWLGRDVFSRVLWGSRITLFWGIMPIAVAVLVGIPTGMLAGYRGGWVDSLTMRLSDLFLSIPPLVLAIAITAALSPSLLNAMFAISIVWWPWYTRLVHAETLALREQIFVKAAQGLGASPLHVITRHIFPNSLSTILVRASMDLGFSVLSMAGLSFIGMGARQPSPEWGLTVSSGRSYMPEYWWVSLFAGLAIFSVVFALNMIGDGIRDVFDPEIRGR